jgi:tellurite resistance protein TerC
VGGGPRATGRGLHPAIAPSRGHPAIDTGIEFWIAFNVGVIALLALDMGVFHRKARALAVTEALAWSAFWIILALAFNTLIWHWKGPEAGAQFLLGYLMEKSLSVDNLFVFVLIFNYFAVPASYQRRVLTLGILGALVMRALFIAAGATLLHFFHWMIYVFGGFLVWTGIRMFFHDDKEELHPEDNPLVRLFRRYIPTTGDYHGARFLVRQEGRLVATPLLVTLLVVEFSDVVFALDSIPAIFCVTQDTFIVYTSNVCAILGLRALYFALAGMLDHFRYLKAGISLVLVFIGAKMLISWRYPMDPHSSLYVVGTILLLSAIASLVSPGQRGADDPGH